MEVENMESRWNLFLLKLKLQGNSHRRVLSASTGYITWKAE